MAIPTRLLTVLPVAILALATFTISGCDTDETRTGVPVKPARTEIVSVGETTTVGPYEVVLVWARFLEDPKPGSELAAAADVPPGKVLLHVRIRVDNIGSEPVPQAQSSTFRLLTPPSEIATPTGIGVAPPRSAPGEDVDPSMSGASLRRPIQPGDYMLVEPQYLVDTEQADVTLLYAPDPEEPDQVLSFELR